MTDLTTSNAKTALVEQLRKSFAMMQGEFEKVLPPYIPAERFVRVVMTSVQKNPALLDANRQSLYQAAMFAAQDGLLPDGAECALVPRKGVVEYTKMYRGLLKLLWQSGQVGSVQTEIIHANDKHDVEFGDQARISHKPAFPGDRGEPIAAYAIIHLKNGFVHRELATVDEIKKAQAMSGAGAGQSTPAWRNWWDQQARKFVLKRAVKLLPLSAEDRERLSDRDDDVIDAVAEPSTAPPTEARPRATRQKPIEPPPPAIAPPVEQPVDVLFDDQKERVAVSDEGDGDLF